MVCSIPVFEATQNRHGRLHRGLLPRSRTGGKFPGPFDRCCLQPKKNKKKKTAGVLMEKVHDSTQKTDKWPPKKCLPKPFLLGALKGLSGGSIKFQSSTCTCWKRRSKAASFSMYFLKLIKPMIFVVVGRKHK